MEILIEKRRRVVVRRRGRALEDWCIQCARVVNWLTPEEAVILTGIGSRLLYQMVEAGQIHFTESGEGLLRVCLPSLAPDIAGGQSEPIPHSVLSLVQTPLPSKVSPGTTAEIPPSPETITAQPRKASPTKWTFDQTAWEKLLACLDADTERAAEKYVALRERLAKFFECRGCGSALDLADETINRVARRLSEGETIRAADCTAYFYGVARNVMREDQESRKRQFLSLDDLNPAEHPSLDPAQADFDEQRHQQFDQLMDCLNLCLAELPEETRRLLLDYHRHEKRARIKARREMAERMGITVNALKIRVHRIRTNLGRRLNAQLDRKAA